jgi:multisubunit Na+/H+ antiporter MnhB subunit
MTAVEIAERKGRWRAFAFLFLAALTCAVMVAVRNDPGSDFKQGLWVGVLVGCTLNLLPIKRWLRPNSEVLRLLEDEVVTANRRLSCVIGFWAAILVALFYSFASHFDPSIGAGEVGQVVATADIVLAMLAFGILELHSAR